MLKVQPKKVNYEQGENIRANGSCAEEGANSWI